MSEIFDQIDQLHNQGKFEEIYNIVEKVIKVNDDNLLKDHQFLWRAARCYFDKADEKPDDKEFQKHNHDKAHERAKQAVNLAGDNDPNGYCNKWFSITLSSLNPHLSTKEKIKNGYLIKQHLDKAIEINPNDPVTQHVAGRWCFSVASISTLERMIATTLFGKPPTSTINDAIEYFLRCEELSVKLSNPIIRNKFFLGESYLLLKNKFEAKKWFQSVLDSKSLTKNDDKLKSDAQGKLAKL